MTTDVAAVRAAIAAEPRGPGGAVPIEFAEAMKFLAAALNTQSLLLCDVLEGLREMNQRLPGVAAGAVQKIAPKGYWWSRDPYTQPYEEYK